MSKLDLEQQRKRAKDLRRAHARGDADAAQRIARHLPRARGQTVRQILASPFKLSDAQLVVAREAGFASWRQLRHTDGEADLVERALRGDDVDRDLARRSIELAAALGDAEAVRAALDDDATLVDRRGGPRDWTPLLYACCARRRDGDPVAVARLLLDRGADVDATGVEPGYGGSNVSMIEDHVWCPIEGAARAGHAELVELLAARGANVQRTSALVARAVASGSADTLHATLATSPPDWQIGWALRASVEIDRRDLAELLSERAEHSRQREPALGDAIWLGRDAAWIATLLGPRRLPAWDSAYRLAVRLDHTAGFTTLRSRGITDEVLSATDRAIASCFTGAPASAPGPLADRDHRTLAWAVRTGRYDAVPRLLALGLDPDVVDVDGQRPLHIAVRAGHEPTIAALLEAGASKSATDYDGRTPFDEAPGATDLDDDEASAVFERAADAVVSGGLDQLRGLLDAHPELVHARSPRPHRATLLHYSGANGTEDPRQCTPPNAPAIAQLLLERGADPDARCHFYRTACTTMDLLLTSAIPLAAGLDGELVRVLVTGGARIDAADLESAIGMGMARAVAALVEAGAPVDTTYAAAGTGDTALLRRLLDAGANVDERRANGCTALHAAAAMNQLAAAQLLLERGADRSLRDATWNGTPAGWAEHNGHRELAQLLALTPEGRS